MIFDCFETLENIWNMNSLTLKWGSSWFDPFELLLGFISENLLESMSELKLLDMELIFTFELLLGLPMTFKDFNSLHSVA